MPQFDRSLTRLPALIFLASNALIRAMLHQAGEISGAIARFARTLWHTYERFERALLTTVVDALLSFLALRYLLLFIALPAALLVWLRSWLPLLFFFSFVAFACVRYFSVDQVEVERHIESGKHTRNSITRALQLLIRVAAAGLSLYISGPWISAFVIHRANSFFSAQVEFVPLNWIVRDLPIVEGLPSGEPVISTNDLIDEAGRAKAYQAQYVPIGYTTYIADKLRARRTLALYSSPVGAGAKAGALTIRAGTVVKILEAFSIIESPTQFVSNGGRELILPGSVTAKTPEGEVYPLEMGALVIELHPTAGECPTFFISGLGARSLCWTNAVTPRDPIVRTAFRVQPDTGRSYWTALVSETSNAEEWLVSSWALCLTSFVGKTERVDCR